MKNNYVVAVIIFGSLLSGVAEAGEVTLYEDTLTLNAPTDVAKRITSHKDFVSGKHLISSSGTVGDGTITLNITGWGGTGNLISVIGSDGSGYGLQLVKQGAALSKSYTLSLSAATWSEDGSVVFSTNYATYGIGKTLPSSIEIIITPDGKAISVNAAGATLSSADISMRSPLSHVVIGSTSMSGSVRVSIKGEKDENQAVPEPTTATLGLLALAVLSARRRRK